MSGVQETDFAKYKGLEKLHKASFTDFGDNTPAQQTITKQAPGEVYDVSFAENGEIKYTYNESASVTVGSETIINTYTVPVSKDFKIRKILASGCNIGIFRLKVNGSTVLTERTWWTHFNIDTTLENILTNAGDVVTITVENKGSTAQAFESTIIGVEADV